MPKIGLFFFPIFRLAQKKGKKNEPNSKSDG